MEMTISPWVSLLTFVISLIGASAWSAPYIDKKFFSKPTLRGSLISYHLNQGVFNNKSGLMYFLAINVTALNNNFNIKETNIRAWYKNEPTEYKGKQFWARSNEWVDNSANKLRLDIKPEDSLLFVGTIPQNLTKTIYLTFFVDKAQLVEFDKIDVEIEDQSGKTSSLEFLSNSIDGEQMLWDDRIWTKI